MAQQQPGKVPQLPLAEVYKRMAQFLMATLEKFTLEFDAADSGYANATHEEEKVKQEDREDQAVAARLAATMDRVGWWVACRLRW